MCLFELFRRYRNGYYQRECSCSSSTQSIPRTQFTPYDPQRATFFQPHHSSQILRLYRRTVLRYIQLVVHTKLIAIAFIIEIQFSKGSSFISLSRLHLENMNMRILIGCVHRNTQRDFIVARTAYSDSPFTNS
ncbi:hypothetical protein B9Z55_024581 [Caenorhabditis nigoni]|nr:hypothetical protein B9Z55_024581 [Caenorhabditis nigoni]